MGILKWIHPSVISFRIQQQGVENIQTERVRRLKVKIVIKKILLFLSVLLVLFILITLYTSRKYGLVKKAISPNQAEERLNDEKNGLIVSSNYGTTGSGWIISEGEDKGKSVVLIDFGAESDLTGDILMLNKNKFLVQGEKKRINPEDENGLAEVEMVVESWEILYPIKREAIYKGDPRLFPPKKHLDEYDYSSESLSTKESE